MTDTTEWTPERRKEQEAKHYAYIEGIHDSAIVLPSQAKTMADRKYPLPPPEYTYGREILDVTNGWTYRRRSDGVWQFRAHGEWRTSKDTDANVRQRAAEVPLSDAECREIGSVCRGWHETSAAENAAIRAVVARVLRGEVTGNG